MPDSGKADYRATGTALTGYQEHGPYHCEDCIHLRKRVICTHPLVIMDPELKAHGHRLRDGGIEVNPERGCCEYVNQPLEDGPKLGR